MSVRRIRDCSPQLKGIGSICGLAVIHFFVNCNKHLNCYKQYES